MFIVRIQRNLQKPYRVAKLNLLWSKAVHRLTEPKLKSLFTELKIHDKEELAYKHQKSEKPKDYNDGLKEAELRHKLTGIMSTYDLLEVMDLDDINNPDVYQKHKPYEGKVKSDNYKNKSLFKDKKLNKLWERAEIGGFSPEELQTLKEEFLHHEEKVDLYYSLLEKMTDVKDNHKDDQHKSKLEKLFIPSTEEFNLLFYFQMLSTRTSSTHSMKLPIQMKTVMTCIKSRNEMINTKNTFRRPMKSAISTVRFVTTLIAWSESLLEVPIAATLLSRKFKDYGELLKPVISQLMSWLQLKSKCITSSLASLNFVRCTPNTLSQWRSTSL